MKKEVILFVALIFFLLIGVVAAVEAPLWKFEKITYIGPLLRYENFRDGYSLLYPPDWLFKRFVIGKYTFTAFVKEEDGEVVSLFTTVVNDCDPKLDVTSVVKKIFTGPNVEILKEEVMNFPGDLSGYRFELLKSTGGLVLEVMLLIVKADGQYYLLGGQGVPEHFVKYKRIIRQTIDSLEINIEKKESVLHEFAG